MILQLITITTDLPEVFSLIGVITWDENYKPILKSTLLLKNQ